MLPMSYWAVIAVCSYVLFRLIRHARLQQRSKQLGCEPGHGQKNRLPLGIDHFKRLTNADKKFRVPDEFVDIFREEGCHTFATSMMGSSILQTSEPKNVQALLATQFKDFELGELRRKTFFPLLGHGIFTNDGEPWVHSRAMLRPQFVREQVSDLELEERHVQTIFQLLPTGPQGWTADIDIVPAFFRLTIDAATEFFFGQSIESQREAVDITKGIATESRWAKIGQSFDEATYHVGVRGQLFDVYWLHNPKSFRQNCKDVHDFADYFVQKALDETQLERDAGSKTSENKEGKYVFLLELAKVIRDPIALRGELINTLLAGRDTTASLLSWTIWLLARHPSKWHKLRQEILQSFGPAADVDNVTFSGLKSCTYLQYVLNEVLRLFPPVPINSRRATKDTSLPLGGGPDGKSRIFVKKGQEVNYFVYVTHRRRDLWGDDADDFIPERWAKKKPGWDYLPFNGGPRICLGQQFALTEAGYVLTRLVQRFYDIATSDENMVPKHKYGATDAPVDCVVRFYGARSA